MAQISGKFVWFECVTTKVAEAQRFYAELFGWKIEKFPMGDQTYEMIKAGESTIGGYVKRDGKAHWISYLSVADVDKSVAAVKAAGGKVVQEAFDVPTVGRMATVTDPFGATFCLFRGTGDDQPDAPKPPAGTFAWNELWTKDGKGAVAFYEKLFGFTHTDMDMGPQGTYRVLAHGGVPRGGVLEEPSGPAHWLPYVATDDCDAAVERARRAGGTVEVPPTDIPNVGRFAVLRDPNGAAIALIKGQG